MFAWVLWCNRKQLGHKEVKDKIGAMYFALDPEKPYVGTYVIVYLFRRSLFVVVTFSLYYRPGLQVPSMLYMSLLQVSYISQMRYYESVSQRRIEIANECILMGIIYHFILLADPNLNLAMRDEVGNSTITFVSSLLAFNTLVIIVVTVKSILRKCYLSKLKKK